MAMVAATLRVVQQKLIEQTAANDEMIRLAQGLHEDLQNIAQFVGKQQEEIDQLKQRISTLEDASNGKKKA